MTALLAGEISRSPVRSIAAVEENKRHRGPVWDAPRVSINPEGPKPPMCPKKAEGILTKTPQITVHDSQKPKHVTTQSA